MKKIYLILLLVVCGYSIVSAQGVANYGVTRNTGVPFTSISGTGANFGSTWRNGTNTDDNLSAATNIGFTFTYLGTPYTQFSISTNGYLTFNTGTAAVGNGTGAYGYQNTQFSTVAGTVSTLAVFYDDQQTAGNLGTQADLDATYKYLVSGSAPNRVLTVEWINAQDFSTTSTSSFNYQIKLYETSNKIEYNYGTMTLANSSTITTMSHSLGINAATISAVPTVAELLTQQTVNTATFSNTPSDALGGNVPANMPAANSQIVFTLLPVCTTPADQPTGLNLTPSSTSISGTFTAATSAPSNYLVVRTATAAPPTAPVDGTSYTVGASALGGVIVSNGTTTSFNATGLTPSTTYYFWVYSFNGITCTGGPLYQSVSPLTNSANTTACSGLAGTYSVGPTGTYSSLTAAIAAANLGVAGPVIFELQAAYVSSVETFPITIGLFPCGSTTNTVIIRPELGATGLVISSNNTTATIDFNGGNYVAFDGRPGGVGTARELQIINTTTTAPTIRFINDASNNRITYCDVRGAASTQGVITLAGSTFSTGNDNIIIDNNLIRDNGVGFPTNGVYSLGQSATIVNDNSFVLANEIYNYFNASTASSGINVNSNNTLWTISANKLFQTANRTYTSAITNTGINVISGSGYTIANNIIGYANNTQTGTTNMIALSSGSLGGTFPSAYTVGGVPVALRYIGINGSFALAGTNSVITGNNIGGFAMYTSSGAATTTGIFSGIAVTAGNATIGTAANPNVIGANAGNGSIYTATSTTGGQIVGIYASSANTITVQSNIVGALDAMGNSATINGGIAGIRTEGTLGTISVLGNTVGNNTTPNLRMGNLISGGNLSNVGTFSTTSGTGVFLGIVNANSGTVNIGSLASPNTIQNATLFSTSASANFRGIQSSAGTISIVGNTINNLSAATTSTSLSSGGLAGLGIYLSGGTTPLINKNNISNLSLTNTGTGGYNLGGISYTFLTTSVNISQNKIWGLSNASTSTTATAPGTACGIFIRDGNAITTNITNNMISLGNGQTTNTSFIGIWAQYGLGSTTTENLYYNSINIEGTAASGAQSSFGLYRGDFSTTAVTVHIFNAKNNILNNARTGGTGFHFAIANNFGATTSATGWPITASNYNVLNSANASTVGYWTTNQTIAGWRTASGGDANSLSGISVLFVNSANGDLHLNFGATPTQIESGGTVISGLTIDYDNDTRPGPTGSTNGGGVFPDMGADEFDGVPLDVTAPVITYTPLTFTCNTGDRIFTATITDVSGVPISGPLQPRVYYRKNAGAWFSSQGTLSSGTDKNGVWSFTIIAADMGGVVGGDNIQYYVIAQDVVGPTNIGSNPSGVVASNVNVVSSAPPTPNSYNIAFTLIGTYNVGAAGIYTTLTAAVNAYNNNCLGGAVVFNLIDATYPSETYPITILANPNASATNTLTIKPNAPGTVISGSSASANIKIFGGDYITIDGSSNGTNSKDLTIENTNNVASTTNIWVGSTATDSSNFITLKNTIYKTGSSTVPLACIAVSDGTTVGALPTKNNNNIVIDNNTVTKSQYGIAIVGNSTPSFGTNKVITNNIVGSNTSTDIIGFRGIFVAQETGANISNNNVFNIVGTASNPTGFFLSNLSNSTINANRVDSIHYTGTGGYGGKGIDIFNGLGNANANNIISNNMISRMRGDGWSSLLSDAIIGIRVGANASTSYVTGNYKIYNNSVSLGGSFAGNTSGTVSAALYLSSNTSNIDLRNNILVNSLDNTAATDKAYAINTAATAASFTNINYNDYYVSGAAGVLGFLVADAATLPAWRTATTQDVNSVNVAPVFASSSDLHLTTANCGLDTKGTAIAAVPNDYDAQVRDALTPDIGADEFVSTASSALYNTVGTTITDTRNVTSTEIFRASNCERFAQLTPNGGSPVNGLVTARVYKYATVQIYNAEPYVQRVIDITPASGAATATGRVTLYYTQTEFDAFNTASGPWPDLPTGPADVVGISNLRITKYGGTPNTTPSSPNMYSAGTALYINPADADIVWNATDSRWEVTVDVTGFSGFYIHTNAQYILPVSINYLNGTKQGSVHNLNWQVTCNISPSVTMVLERSSNNRTFNAINTLSADAVRCSQPFNYVDASPLIGMNYYRLKTIDAYGKVIYSNTIAILNAVDGIEVLNVAPNPVTASGAFKLNIAAAKATSNQVVITDLQGRIVERKTISLIAGYNSIDMNVAKLSGGTYQIQVFTATGDKLKVLRFVKE